MHKAQCNKHSGLSSISQKSDDVADYYDGWAPDYDVNFADWSYKAPDRVASILRTKLSPDSKILDAGCGTGLGGRTLRSVRFTTIDGIDISKQSLEIAGMTDAYRTLRAMNMQQLPLSIPANHYDGLICVGVLTYLPDSSVILKEFSRIVKPKGTIVVTQRSDLFVDRNFKNVLDELSDKGVIDQLQISEPQPYLPDNEEFSDQILVHYISFTVVEGNL